MGWNDEIASHFKAVLKLIPIENKNSCSERGLRLDAILYCESHNSMHNLHEKAVVVAFINNVRCAFYNISKSL